MVSEGCDIDPNYSISNLTSIGPQTYRAPSGGTEASPVSCWLHGHSLQGRCERVIHSAYQLQHMLVRWYWTDAMSSLLRRMVPHSIPRSRIVHVVPDAVPRTAKPVRVVATPQPLARFAHVVVNLVPRPRYASTWKRARYHVHKRCKWYRVWYHPPPRDISTCLQSGHNDVVSHRCSLHRDGGVQSMKAHKTASKNSKGLRS
jgi:hypothetical protein